MTADAVFPCLQRSFPAIALEVVPETREIAGDQTFVTFFDMAEIETINVTANGTSFSVPSDQPLEAFLSDRGFAPDLVVVERNLQPVSPSERPTVHLQEGDRLEIVRIVAGG